MNRKFLFLLGIGFLLIFVLCSFDGSQVQFRPETIVYKTVDGEELLLDVYLPWRDVFEKTPVAIYIYGGGFVQGSKENLLTGFKRSLGVELLRAGYAVVSINYRLVDGVTVFPMNIEDCKDAVRWVFANGEAYGFDLNNVGVWGTSAGGHLALMMGLTDEDDFVGEAGLAGFRSEVQWVIDFFGPSNFDVFAITPKTDHGQEITERYWGNGVEYEALLEMIDTHSPLSYVDENSPPVMIVHGTADDVVDVAQSEVLFAALEEMGRPVEMILLDGVNHSLLGASDEEVDDVVAAALEFVLGNYR